MMQNLFSDTVYSADSLKLQIQFTTQALGMKDVIKKKKKKSSLYFVLSLAVNRSATVYCSPTLFSQ